LELQVRQGSRAIQEQRDLQGRRGQAQLAPRESKVTKAFRVQQDPQDPRVSRDPRVTRGFREQRETRDRRESKVFRV
jgi:hypothetical protein